MLSQAPGPRRSPMARPPTNRRAARVEVMIIASPCRVMAIGVVASEPDVDSEGVVRGRRRGLEVALHADVVAEVAPFGVNAGVSRQDAQIPPGRRDADLAGGEVMGRLVRQIVGGGYLAEPEQVGLLDVAELGVARVNPHGDGAGLLGERGGAIHVAPAVEPVLAADPLGAVELVAAELSVRQGADLKLPAEQSDGAVRAELGRRKRGPDVHRRVAHEELADRGYGVPLDDPVAVDVLVGERPEPPPLDRIALDVGVGGAAARRQTAQARGRVAVVGTAEGEIPADLLALENVGVDRRLDPAIADLPDIHELRGRGP